MADKDDPVAVAEDFGKELQRVFQAELQSVLLVGSAARGDFRPGKSDINTLVILSPRGMENLDKVYPLMKGFQRRRLGVPHFMTRDSVLRSLDSYPLELLDFKTFHRVLIGSDMLADLEFQPGALRLQIEREARGKLFLLRQALALHAGHEKELGEILKRALTTFTALMQGILALHGQPIPADRLAIFQKASAIANFSPEVFQEISKLRAGHGGKDVPVIFINLLREAGKIVQWVDRSETA